jgi:hypothetical protein
MAVSGILMSMVSQAAVDFQPAQITTADGATAYALTPADVLLAARAVSYESKKATDPAKVLWTLTQRWVRWQCIGKPMSFKASTEGFSQPINPAWRAGGAKCQQYPADCSAAALARREAAAVATWDDLLARDDAEGLNAVAATRLWAQARLPNPVPTVTNFAVASVAANYLSANPASRLYEKDEDGHWYIIDPPATRWPLNFVTMVSPTGARAGPLEGPRTMLRHAADSFWDAFSFRSYW